MRSIILILLFCTALMGKHKKTIRYVALGDSYTIGTGAKPEEAWPELLTKHLNEKNIKTKLTLNLGENGFTTQNLIDVELPYFDKGPVDLATVLIGVNDWVRGVDTTTYHKNLAYILDHIQSKMADKKKIVLITIPDFGVTPQGGRYSAGRDISKGITEFNNIIIGEAKKRGLPLVDIFGISKKMKDNATLVSSDGLHPSAKEYAVWETLILPTVVKLF